MVEAVGPDCTLLRPDDAVFYTGSIIRSGSNGEPQLVDERIAGPNPTSLPFPDAAPLPLTAVTA